jgi:hypothetical protein
MARNLPVHKSMLEVSELIYETCKSICDPGQVPEIPALIAVVIAFSISRCCSISCSG